MRAENVKPGRVYRLTGAMWPRLVVSVTGDNLDDPKSRIVTWSRVSWCDKTRRWFGVVGGRTVGQRRLDTFARAATWCGVWPDRLTGPHR